MRSWLKRCALLCLLCASVNVRAEFVYVSEGVNVGVHQQAALSSTILTLLPPGSRLEVLERNNGLVKVRLSSGTEGWVDARYLTETAVVQPPRNEGVEAELVQTATELARARERASELEYQLNRERERAGIMEAELLKARKELEQRAKNNGDSAAASADALRKLRKATDENRKMKKQVDELETKMEALAKERGEPEIIVVERGPLADDDATLMERYTAIKDWQLWQIMLLFFSLLLAFAAGGYVVDWEMRRRHGGFRV